MATKLRKFSYSIFLKVIIFLLTAGCISIAGRAIFKIAVSDLAFYRNHGTDYSYNDDFLTSWTFTRMVQKDIGRIETYAERYHGNENYVKSGQAWSDYVAKLKDDSAKATEREINEKIKEYIDNYGYTDTNNEDDITPSTSENNETTAVAVNSGDTAYTLEYAKQVLDPNDYSALEEQVEIIRNNNNDILNNSINSAKSSFLSDYESIKKELSSIQSLKYVYDDGNVFFTNIEGAEKQSDKNYTSYFSSLPFFVTADGIVSGNIGISSAVVTANGIINENSNNSNEIAERSSSSGNLSIGINTNMISAGIANDKYTRAAAEYNSIYYTTQNEIVDAAVSIIIALIGVIYLMITAGRKDKNEPVEEAAIDRCFHDLHFLISGAIIFAATAFFIELYGSTWNITATNEIAQSENLFTAAMFALSLIFLEWFMSFVRAFKARTLIKHSLWYIIVRKIAHFFKKCANKIKAAFDLGYHFKCLKKSILWKALFFFAVNTVFFLIGVIDDSGESLLFLCLIPAAVFNTIFLMKIFQTIKNLDKIFAEIRKGAQGDFNFSLDYSNMKEPVKGFARDVENMQQGLKIAVEEAIKGERMKTELITNVSHDLKTPLTSIINYVDLLGRCDITDETAKEYIGVLNDKSAKLKKLIEDLVEASKASTGNVKINKIKMNLYELAVQAVGEHEDALAERGIEVRINTPEKQPVVLADNQKTWRIIDNLFSNVKKYSLKGSRAYITVDENDGWGRFSIKNISEKALDISPDELTQRFVRGDASRSTEGSGLGLSIAKSLCELQGGRFTIEIDGDLFKATLELPLVSEDEEANKKSLLEHETASRYSAQNVNLNASFNLPPDLKISEQMAEQLRRRQIDAAQNLTPPTDIK